MNITHLQLVWRWRTSSIYTRCESLITEEIAAQLVRMRIQLSGVGLWVETLLHTFWFISITTRLFHLLLSAGISSDAAGCLKWKIVLYAILILGSVHICDITAAQWNVFSRATQKPQILYSSFDTNPDTMLVDGALFIKTTASAGLDWVKYTVIL